jgi:hypothetical protein
LAARAEKGFPGAIVRIVSIFVIIFLFPSLLLAKREHPEKWYQERWCREQGGQIEVVLPDRTRCDCVTDTHAIEFDFGGTWILYELEVVICKAFKVDGVLLLLRILNNEADGNLRLALWVKNNEKNRLSSDLAYKTSFSLIFIQDLGNGWAEAIGQGLHYSSMTKKKAGVVLILETMKDRKYWIRLKTTIEHFNLPIETWAVGNAAY